MCGIILGVDFLHRDVTGNIIQGTIAMQNRGQQGVGVVIGDSHSHKPHRHWKQAGSADEWFGPKGNIKKITREYKLRGNIGGGHVRYSTASAESRVDAQPHYRGDGGLYIFSNGDIPFCSHLRRQLSKQGEKFRSKCDAEVIAALLYQAIRKNGDEVLAFIEVLSHLKASFSLGALLPSNRAVIARDPVGNRPLCYYYGDNQFWACSESIVLQSLLQVSEEEIHEVPPGTIILIDPQADNDHRVQFYSLDCPVKEHYCLLELFYFGHPCSQAFEEDPRTNLEIRNAFGWELGDQWATAGYPIPDIVCPIPESGEPAAKGVADRLRTEPGAANKAIYRKAIQKERFASGRYFQKSRKERLRKLRRKFHVIKGIVCGKRVLVVDDTIMRGDQIRAIIEMLRSAGAAEVWVGIAAPKVTDGCFYGINIPDKYQLVANGKTVAQIKKAIGLKRTEKLIYLNLTRIFRALGHRRVCTGCLNRIYPIPVPTKGRKEV